MKRLKAGPGGGAYKKGQGEEFISGARGEGLISGVGVGVISGAIGRGYK